MKIPALKLFDAVSDQAREQIFSLVLKHYQKHPNSPWSGKYLVELERSVKAFYAEMGEKYDECFRESLPEMMREFYDRAKEEIRTAGKYKAVLGEPDPHKIKYALESSYKQVAMRTDKMSFDHIRSLRQISADVFRQMSITGGTRREVSKALLDRAMEIPGFQFIDRAGTKWSAKSYFQMLARTELMNSSRACYDDKMADEGFDVMRLTTSGDPCDKCSKYEGRLFSLTGGTPGLPTKSDLEAAGVFHPNCTHTYSLIPDFIFERDYNPDGTKKEKSDAPLWGSKKQPHEPESYKAKFTGELTKDAKKLKKELERAGGSPEQIDEILWNYTPEVQSLIGRRVSAKFVSGCGCAGTTPDTTMMEFDKNPLEWMGCRQTITHEFGHSIFNSIFGGKRPTHDIKEFYAAVEADRAFIKGKKWIDQYFGCVDMPFRKEEVENELSESLFNIKKYSDLSIEQQWKITAKADILGALTGGEYGFGHTSYSQKMIDEAFSNIYLAKKYGWNDYSESFPNLWQYIGGVL